MVSTRLAALFGALMFVFTLSACGGSDDSSSSTTAAVAEAAEDAMDEAAETASDAMDAAGEMADDAADAAGEMADDAMAAAGEMADDAKDAAGEMAHGAMAAAGEMADDAKTAAGEMADDAKAAAGEAMEKASGAMAAAGGGEGCTFDVKVGDQLAFSTSSISAPASCGSVTVNLTHTGNLPKAAMGHNWVLIPKDEVEAVATAGMSAGVDGNYLADGEDRYIAATKIIGGGESDSVTFSLSDLDPDAEYMYICTFPGHWSVMRGTFTIS
ncbi:MAG: azurin [Pseudomonadota bacterium]